jgi:multidrug efflux system membrane fusion protein
VELGQVDGERVVVKSGVQVGDVVVTDGGDRLRDGALVQLPEATAAEVSKGLSIKQDQQDDRRDRRGGQRGGGGGQRRDGGGGGGGGGGGFISR